MVGDSKVEPGIYEHYKGKQYEVIGTALHSETQEVLVVYKMLYEGSHPKGTLWARPLGMFLEPVELGGKWMPRFRRLDVR